MFAEESESDEEAEKEPEWKKRKIWSAAKAAHVTSNGLVFVCLYKCFYGVSDNNCVLGLISITLLNWTVSVLPHFLLFFFTLQAQYSF